MTVLLARTVFLLLVAVSLAMFLTPIEQVPRTGPDDKVVHLLIFATLAVAGRWARLAAVPLGLGLAAYGVATELLQAALPIGREGDPRDVAADLAGVVVALLAVMLVARLVGWTQVGSTRPPDA